MSCGNTNIVVLPSLLQLSVTEEGCAESVLISVVDIWRCDCGGKGGGRVGSCDT